MFIYQGSLLVFHRGISAMPQLWIDKFRAIFLRSHLDFLSPAQKNLCRTIMGLSAFESH
jgi:hypothetical protein